MVANAYQVLIVVVIDQNVISLKAQQVDVLVLNEADVLGDAIEAEVHFDGRGQLALTGLIVPTVLVLVQNIELAFQRLILARQLIVNELLQYLIDLSIPAHLLLLWQQFEPIVANGALTLMHLARWHLLLVFDVAIWLCRGPWFEELQETEVVVVFVQFFFFRKDYLFTAAFLCALKEICVALVGSRGGNSVVGHRCALL